MRATRSVLAAALLAAVALAGPARARITIPGHTFDLAPTY